MEWVEVRAENIEAAEELALDQLGVAREDAEFEVVTREENRLFGLKKTEARVRARVKPADLPSKTTNNRKRSKNSNKKQQKIALKSDIDDGFLTEKAAEQWHTAKRHGADKKRPVCSGHSLA